MQKMIEIAGEARKYCLRPDASPKTIESYAMDGTTRAATLAALNASRWVGKANKDAADGDATTGMEDGLNTYLPVAAEIAVGEGKLDQAPMLYFGQRLGPAEGPVELQLAVDPIDGTNPVAHGWPGGIAVIAGALVGQGSLLATEYEGHMWHFIFSPEVMLKWRECLDQGGPPSDVKDFNPFKSPFDQDIEVIARFVAWARKGNDIGAVKAGALMRDCNSPMISKLRGMGVSCSDPKDGSVALALDTQDTEHELDFCFGRIGSPEAVIAATAVRIGRGYGCFRWYTDEVEDIRQDVVDAGFNPDQKYCAHDLAGGDVFLSVSSITGTDTLRPISVRNKVRRVESMCGRSRTGTYKIIRSVHFDDSVLFEFNDEFPEIE